MNNNSSLATMQAFWLGQQKLTVMLQGAGRAADLRLRDHLAGLIEDEQRRLSVIAGPEESAAPGGRPGDFTIGQLQQWMDPTLPEASPGSSVPWHPALSAAVVIVAAALLWWGMICAASRYLF